MTTALGNRPTIDDTTRRQLLSGAAAAALLAGCGTGASGQARFRGTRPGGRSPTTAARPSPCRPGR